MTPNLETAAAQNSAIVRAGRLMRQMAGRVKRRILPEKDYVVHEGSVLPAPGLRFNGPDQQDDQFYLQSSLLEAERVITKLGCRADQFLLDIGCGQGRMPIGLARRLPAVRYLGIDVSKPSIDWCMRHITARYPSYEFRHINVVNARYNPAGEPLPIDFRLPVADATVDLIYMWGVVTNMEPEFLPVYAREMSRMLRAGGKLFLTANVEDDVPVVSINPESYTSFACQGPLHIVRYERRYFVELLEQAGLVLTELSYHAAGNCQSDMYFIKRQQLS